MKSLKVIISLLILSLLSPLVFAQNNSTMQSIPDISNPNKGLEIMLQLELRIDEMIERANTIIEEVQIRNNLELEDDPIVRLESYIESLNEIKFNLESEKERFEEELNSTSQENSDFIVEDMREEIYMSVEQARSLAKDFRTTLAPLLDEEQKEQIREEVKERVEKYKERREKRREEIRNKIDEQRKKSIVNRAREFENTTGIKGVSSHAQQLANGEITVEEFRQKIRDFIRENREKNIEQRIKEKKEEREQIREQRRERIEERVAARIERNKQRREERIQERINRARERVQERREELINRRDEIGNISEEDLNNLTTYEILEKINSLSPEEKEKISQEIGVDITLVPKEMLRDVISNFNREQIETYINQAQSDVPVEITQQGRVREDGTR